jgi:hypothetical protein
MQNSFFEYRGLGGWVGLATTPPVKKCVLPSRKYERSQEKWLKGVREEKKRCMFEQSLTFDFNKWERVDSRSGSSGKTLGNN